MRVRGRQALSWMAIYAVALHTILLGFVSPLMASQAAQFDPFSVICHSADTASTSDQAPGKPGLAPGQACEHCNLCNIIVLSNTPDVAVIANLAPTRVLHTLQPASVARSVDSTANPRLTRGPPYFA